MLCLYGSTNTGNFFFPKSRFRTLKQAEIEPTLHNSMHFLRSLGHGTRAAEMNKTQGCREKLHVDISGRQRYRLSASKSLHRHWQRQYRFKEERGSTRKHMRPHKTHKQKESRWGYSITLQTLYDQALSMTHIGTST